MAGDMKVHNKRCRLATPLGRKLLGRRERLARRLESRPCKNDRRYVSIRPVRTHRHIPSDQDVKNECLGIAQHLKRGQGEGGHHELLHAGRQAHRRTPRFPALLHVHAAPDLQAVARPEARAQMLGGPEAHQSPRGHDAHLSQDESGCPVNNHRGRL
eukprot:1186490-Prorocentrum_minimum.AAC.3